jgi:hypothetical protein
VLDALQAESLQVLVLEGLAQAEFSLFSHISNRFPYLLALTVIRRASDRQLVTRHVRWPGLSWEYPQHMQGFSHLKYFSWNFNHGPIFTQASTALLHFENGFSSSKMASREEYDDLEEGLDDYFDDDKWLPRLFAVYCPSLEVYTDRVDWEMWRFRRSPASPIGVEMVNTYGEFPPESETWNPSDWWSPVSPNANEVDW